MALLIVAVVVEAVVNGLKPLWDAEKRMVNFPALASLVVGLAIAFVAQIDLFTVLDIPVKYPYVGQVLTGIIIARGSNFVHDLLSIVFELKNKQ